MELHQWNLVKHIFPHVQGLLCILLELSLTGHIHFEESSRTDMVLQKWSLSLAQSGYFKYRCLLLRLSQGPNPLEMCSKTSLCYPQRTMLGHGRWASFIWISMRNWAKSSGDKNKGRAFFWGHLFLNSIDTVICLGSRVLNAYFHRIKKLQFGVRTPLCWTLQIQNL